VTLTNPLLETLNRAWHLPPKQRAQFGQRTGYYPIDRDDEAPWCVGTVMGTDITALRIGPVGMVSAPGEPFPALRLAIARATSGARMVVMLSKAQDDFGYMYPAYLAALPPLYNTDHAELNVAPQMGDQLVLGQVANLHRLGFRTQLPVEKPPGTRVQQKLMPGLQADASPSRGVVRPGHRLRTVVQAVFMPASVTDGQIAGKVHWSFGDGTSATSGWLQVGQDYGQTGQGRHGRVKFVHRFAPGRHVVHLSAVSTHGERVTWSFPVVVGVRGRR
jgi:hypothetical protein